MDPVAVAPMPPPIDVVRYKGHPSRYVDAAGVLHVVGEVTNGGAESVTLALQATLYDQESGADVLDAASFDMRLPLGPR